MSAATEAGGAPWRVSSHYGIHVYEGERPVATFHRAEDATRAVLDRAAMALPTAPGADVEALRAEVANLQARLAGSEAERCKMADTAVAGWVEHNRLRWDAEDRATAAEAALAKARADALEEAAKIVEGFGRIALMAYPGLGATVDYALIPLHADHIPGVIRAAALTPTDGGPHDHR